MVWHHAVCRVNFIGPFLAKHCCVMINAIGLQLVGNRLLIE